MATILIAEDRDVNIMLLKAMLSQVAGDAEIHVALNGQEAVDKTKELSPDLIFMDFSMPVMDGNEATIKIREAEQNSDNHIPIIALTASTDDDEVQSYLKAGMDDFLAKPIIMEDLQEKVRKYL